ncbi:MAG: hypothetical protein RPU64_16800 [Candidatus Sedimenticola sp. (ex Thyasira tokunagai)]
MQNKRPLDRLIAVKTDPNLTRSSRIHRLNAYLPGFDSAAHYIKREDELNAGVVGSKWRKYLSLLPALEHLGVDEAILIGSAHSNNVMGLAQILIERGIGVCACVKQPGSNELNGNHLLLRMLVDDGDIRYLSHSEWPQAETIAQQWAVEREQQGKTVVVIPEGGDHPDVLPGTLTLAQDLYHNEQQLGTLFNDIWTDSGTGVSSIGLLLGLRLLGMVERRVHITLIAGCEREFHERYLRHQQWLEAQLQETVPKKGPVIDFHKPATAPSFGSVNKTLLRETATIARQTGILMDPVYSAKHLYTVKCAMEVSPPEGAQLILYNGGPLGLCGFQKRLADVVQ